MPKRKVTSANEARQYAMDWQSLASEDNYNMSYGELLEWQDIFVELAHVYGLEAEFKENGII